MKFFKTNKKKFIAAILVIATLTALLGISGNAYQRYNYTYKNSDNENLLSVYLGVYHPTVKSFGDMQIWSNAALSTYNFGVVTSTIKGYLNGNQPLWVDDYNYKYQQYYNKQFDDSRYTSIDHVGNVSHDYTNASLLPVSCHILYVAGKSASHYSSSYPCSFDYFDEEYMVFHTIYFSKVAYGNVSANWYVN